MSYHGVGAGPGPVEKYKVDAPWPWGDNTEIAVPVQEMVNDAWNAARPHVDELEAKLIDDMENEAALYAPKLVKNIMDTIVLPDINNELEVAMAELDVMKSDVVQTLVAVGASLAIVAGIGAWWLKKGH